MSPGAASDAVSTIRSAIANGLGADLRALYLYGSLSTGYYQANQSDVNLLIIFEDDVDLHRIREKIKPIWQDYSPILKKTPLISSISTIKRHLDLNPELAHHIATDGKLLEGEDLISRSIPFDPLERLSRFIGLIINTSLAVAPSLLTEKEAIETKAKLNSLYRQYFSIHVEENFTPVELVARLQRELSGDLRKNTQIFVEDRKISGAPPLIEDLEAIYEVGNRLVLVLPDLEPDILSNRILSIDWLAVADRVADQYRGLQVATPTELRLLMHINTSADQYLRSYDHAWGIDPLADLQIEKWRVYRDLARFPSEILLSTLPHAYVTTDDADLAMLVHDFQNKLLNIQLRNELLCRIDQVPIAQPPHSLPGRDEPVYLRIDAICSHLDWWVDYYTEWMLKALQNQSSVVEI